MNKIRNQWNDTAWNPVNLVNPVHCVHHVHAVHDDAEQMEKRAIGA